MVRKLYSIVILFVVCSLSACHENHFNPNQELTLERFSSLKKSEYSISKVRISEQIGQLIKVDHDTMAVDRQLRQYYLGGGHLLWFTRNGISPQADSLLIYINKVDEIGFNPERFKASAISADLQKAKELDFSECDINTLVARLDYNLTKAYLRYVVGQRYGFVNPYKVFNHLDRDMDDTIHVHFRQLYDDKTETVSAEGYARLLDKIRNDSVGVILREAQPKSALYDKLKSMLADASPVMKEKIMVNMERCRWRKDDYASNHQKYIVVNIPSYGLMAVDGDGVLEMKVVCGSRKTKTPLVHSRIMRMDLNPKWIMPQSIVKKDMAAHAGDVEYFASRNYYITNRSTGERVSPDMVTAADLRSGGYGVAQEGGEGNALGRIIFRFPNNFAIYLHDTSSKSAFGRGDRSLSHGCVRVEKPFELAKFLLKDKNESVIEKIDYSMNIRTRVPTESEEGLPEYKVDKSKLIHSLAVDPQIPLFIEYMTISMDPKGQLRYYEDVYGYDFPILRILRGYK